MPKQKHNPKKFGLAQATPKPPPKAEPVPETAAARTPLSPASAPPLVTLPVPRPLAAVEAAAPVVPDAPANRPAVEPTDGEQEPPRMLTRSQKAMGRALDDVGAMTGQHSDTTKKTYGGLCHAFPILVRQNGLGQALAFIEVKATSGNDQDRKAAYAVLQRHIAGMLGVAVPEQLLNHVRNVDARQYLHETRVLLDAWIYYKRFATSLLNVTSAEAASE